MFKNQESEVIIGNKFWFIIFMDNQENQLVKENYSRLERMFWKIATRNFLDNFSDDFSELFYIIALKVCSILTQNFNKIIKEKKDE